MYSAIASVRASRGARTTQQTASGSDRPLAVIGVSESHDPAWPVDPDEVPAWRLAQEHRAAQFGYRLPTYRTRREFERAMVLAASRASHGEPDMAKPALSPDDAAADFLSSLRAGMDVDGVLEFSATELSEAYASHCASTDRIPTPVDRVKSSLALIDPRGVRRELRDERDANGRRVRPTIWIILPAVDSEDSADMAMAA